LISKVNNVKDDIELRIVTIHINLLLK